MYLTIVADDYFKFFCDIKQLDANIHSRDTNTHARDFIFSEIIQRVVAYEDPPFRPDLTRVDVRPEFVDLIVDCWCEDPEERPHFFRIVERLKKISGRSVVLQVIVEVLDTTLPIIRLRRRLGRCCVELHCGTVLVGGRILDPVTRIPSKWPIPNIIHLSFLFSGGGGWGVGGGRYLTL